MCASEKNFRYCSDQFKQYNTAIRVETIYLFFFRPCRACTSKPAEENLEKYLAELEMKLQLLAEDIAVSLEDHSTQALQRVPRALGEVREDVTL